MADILMKLGRYLRSKIRLFLINTYNMQDIATVKLIHSDTKMGKVFSYVYYTILIMFAIILFRLILFPYSSGFWAGRITAGFKDGVSYVEPKDSTERAVELSGFH